MTEKQRSEAARQRLDRYLRLAQQYRDVWGSRPDRETFLNLWVQARKEAV